MARDYQYLFSQLQRIEKHREEKAEKEIRKLYKQILKETKQFIAEEYYQLAEDGKLTYEILRSKGQDVRFLEEVEQRLGDVSIKTSDEIKQAVEDIYRLAYNGVKDAVQNGKDTAAFFEGLDTNTVQLLRSTVDNPLMDIALEKNHKEITWGIKREIATALTVGDRYETIAHRIADNLDRSYRKGVLIARTEMHRVREAGHQEAAKAIDETLQKGSSGMRMVKKWKTMKDGAVRPQSRYKTKKGWKTGKIRAGAPDHMKMHDVVVLEDELFDLGGGVKAIAPGQSGVAGHDCNCRCQVLHLLMDDEEFFKATGRHFANNNGLVSDTRFMWSDDFSKEMQQSYTEMYNKLSEMYPLSNVRIEVVGDTFKIRGWSGDLPDDKIREDIIYENLGQIFGAQYMPKGMRVLKSKGAFIEIADNERAVVSLDDWFRQMHQHKVKNGTPKTLAECFNNAAEGTEAIMAHEYAHAIADNYGFYGSDEGGKWLRDIFNKYDDFEIAKQVSRYATTSPDEFFAECFVKSFDEYSESKIAREVMDELSKRYIINSSKSAKKAVASVKKADIIKLEKTTDALPLSTYFNRSEPIYERAKKVKPIKDYEDVFIHGDATGFSINNANGDLLESYTPREFAEILKNDPNYHGGDIRLCSCGTGAEDAFAAEALARQLGVNVLAPSNTLWIDMDGNMTIGENFVDNDGEWILFKGRK